MSKPPVCTQNTSCRRRCTIAPATVCSASAKPLFGYVTVGAYVADLRHAIERRERGLRGRVHEREVRLIDRQVRRDARRAVAREPSPRRRCSGSRRRSSATLGIAGTPTVRAMQRARRLARRGPRRQRIDGRRQRVEIAARASRCPAAIDGSAVDQMSVP